MGEWLVKGLAKLTLHSEGTLWKTNLSLLLDMETSCVYFESGPVVHQS